MIDTQINKNDVITSLKNLKKGAIFKFEKTGPLFYLEGYYRQDPYSTFRYRVVELQNLNKSNYSGFDTVFYMGINIKDLVKKELF